MAAETADVDEGMSDSSSENSDCPSGYETPSTPRLRPLGELDRLYAIVNFCNALRDGDFEVCARIALVTPGHLLGDFVGFSNAMSLSPYRPNRRHPSATPIHEIIAHEQRFPSSLILGRYIIQNIMQNFSRMPTTNMRLLSSGYDHCRMHPGLPTVDPLFFAAHKGRAREVLRWYITFGQGRYGFRIQHRPLLWWLVRHEDPVDIGVLLDALDHSEVNWGTWVWRRIDGHDEVLSHPDFTALDLALIRQPDRVVEILREKGAKTSLEVFASTRLQKLYRPGFPEDYDLPAPKESMRKRRSSFGFAEEALSSADADHFREPGTPWYLDPDVESHIFWDGKPYGPLPRRRLFFERTVRSKMQTAQLFWWEEQNMHLGYQPDLYDLIDYSSELKIPENLVHWPLLDALSS